MKWSNLQKTLEQYTSYFDKGVKDKMPDTYEIKNNIEVDLQIGEYVYSVTFKAPDYFKYIEYGRGPGGMPPVHKIEEWIEKKRIIPYPTRDNKLPSTHSIAFLIARKIAREGTSIYKAGGLKIYERTQEEQKSYWDEQISNAITDDITAELSSFLNLLQIN